MAFEIVYKPYAERDIWEIASALADYSVPAAEKLLRLLRERIEGLAEMR